MDWSEDEESAAAPAPPADCDEALARLKEIADPSRAPEIARKQKISREVLGCALPDLSDLAGVWRAALPLEARLDLAGALWQSGIFEARIMAAKLLTQARIRPEDGAVWELIKLWLAEGDCAVIADHVARAGERRLLADPARLDEIGAWAASENPWLRQAIFLVTLPWARMVHPKEADLQALTRVIAWAADLSQDGDRRVQQALALWLRELSRRRPDETIAFLTAHGRNLQVFARKEAAQLLAAPILYDPLPKGEEPLDEDQD